MASFGADVIVRRGDDVADRIREHAPDGVDGLADGSVQMEPLVAAVRDGGGFALGAGWPGNGERGIQFHITWVFAYDKDYARLDRLRQQAEDGPGIPASGRHGPHGERLRGSRPLGSRRDPRAARVIKF